MTDSNNCRWQFAVSVFSGCTVMLTLGTNYCLGGLAPYLISHLRVNSSGSGDSSDNPDGLSTGAIVWVFVAAAFFQGVGILLGGLMTAAANSIDKRWWILTGCMVSSVGTLLTAHSVTVSFLQLLITAGCIFGIGQGVAYAIVLESVTSWSSNHKCIVTGILVSFFALGPIVFVPVQSVLINPGNLTPNWSVGRDKLFKQPEVLNRVPFSYLIMALIYSVIQLLSVYFIRHCPDKQLSGQTSTESTALRVKSEETTTTTTTAESDKSWTLAEALQSLPFIVMSISIFFLTPATIVMPSLDKSYGETFIFNDILLSTLAGVAAAFNALGRLAAGLVADRLHFRVCVLTQGILLAILHSLTPLSVGSTPAVYFILTCLINFAFAGTFVYFPCAVESLYGTELFAQVYGVVYMFKAVSGAFVGLLTTVVLREVGWTVVLLATGGSAAAGGLVILLYNTERWRCKISLF